MNMRTRYADIAPFVTKDGSAIRELMHPASHANAKQSLAEARVDSGQTTALHRHRSSEELYHVTAGEGEMRLGDSRFPVTVGDTIAIAPGTPHCVTNTGQDTLVILCCCSPPYAHEDTDLLDPDAD